MVELIRAGKQVLAESMAILQAFANLYNQEAWILLATLGSKQNGELEVRPHIKPK